MITTRRWKLILLAIAVLWVGVVIGAQIAHHEHIIEGESGFPCQFEDESKVTSVSPGGNRSFCVPTDDLSIGIFDSRGELEEVVTVDEYTYYISHTVR